MNKTTSVKNRTAGIALRAQNKLRPVDEVQKSKGNNASEKSPVSRDFDIPVDIRSAIVEQRALSVQNALTNLVQVFDIVEAIEERFCDPERFLIAYAYKWIPLHVRTAMENPIKVLGRSRSNTVDLRNALANTCHFLKDLPLVAADFKDALKVLTYYNGDFDTFVQKLKVLTPKESLALHVWIEANSFMPASRELKAKTTLCVLFDYYKELMDPTARACLDRIAQQLSSVPIRKAKMRNS